MTLKNKNTNIVLAMSLFVAILSAYSAVLGFVDKDLYGNVVETGVFKMSFMPGTISQDIITIISSVLMVMLIFMFSLFGLIFGLCGLKSEQVVHLYLPKWIRISSTVFYL